MNHRIFVGWAVAALVFGIAAVATAFNQPSISNVELDNEPAFPEVRGSVNDISKVTIATSQDSFALTRKDGGAWVAADKFGYPVAANNVRELILAVAEMKRIEPKTAREELFPRLEVEDTDLEDSRSRLVRFETSSGDVVAEAIFGKSRYRLTGSRDFGTYFRLPTEQQTWLGSGKVEAGKALGDWLEKEIVNLDSDTVEFVRITRSGGTTFSAERPDKDSEFHITGIPEGRRLKQDSTATLASVFARVDLQDVKPRREFEWPAERHTATARTFDGVEVSAEVARNAGENWAIFSARYVGNGDVDTDKAEAARKRAEEINARVEGWAYRIPDYVATRLSKSIDDLLGDDGKTS